MNNKTIETVEIKLEILPLLTAKQANTLASSLTKEMELQIVADKIRMVVNGITLFKYKLELIDIRYGQYIYEELVKNKYSVLFKGPTELTVMWEKV